MVWTPEGKSQMNSRVETAREHSQGPGCYGALVSPPSVRISSLPVEDISGFRYIFFIAHPSCPCFQFAGKAVPSPGEWICCTVFKAREPDTQSIFTRF